MTIIISLIITITLFWIGNELSFYNDIIGLILIILGVIGKHELEEQKHAMQKCAPKPPVLPGEKNQK